MIAVHIGGPFDLLRRVKAVKKASEDELKEIESGAGEWAENAVWLVVVALVAEALVALLPPSWRPAGEFICNAVVAVGVALEVIMSRAGAKAQGELLARSNERLTEAEERSKIALVDVTEAMAQLREANDRLAEAEERAASLEIIAAEARERTAEIERYMGGRRLSPERLRQIVDWARPKVEKLRVLIQFERGDPEAYRYANDLVLAFEIAGADPTFEANPLNAATLFGTFGFCGEFDAADCDAFFQIFERSDAPLQAVAEAFALAAAGTPIRSFTAPNVYVLVGTRGAEWTADALAGPKLKET